MKLGVLTTTDSNLLYIKDLTKSLYGRDPFKSLVRLKLAALLIEKTPSGFIPDPSLQAALPSPGHRIKLGQCIMAGRILACFPLHNQEAR